MVKQIVHHFKISNIFTQKSSRKDDIDDWYPKNKVNKETKFDKTRSFTFKDNTYS